MHFNKKILVVLTFTVRAQFYWTTTDILQDTDRCVIAIHMHEENDEDLTTKLRRLIKALDEEVDDVTVEKCAVFRPGSLTFIRPCESIIFILGRKTMRYYTSRVRGREEKYGLNYMVYETCTKFYTAM